jgi:hypothetical protein
MIAASCCHVYCMQYTAQAVQLHCPQLELSNYNSAVTAYCFIFTYCLDKIIDTKDR